MHGGSGFGLDPAALEEDGDAQDDIGIGHFGMVTSVAARPIINSSNSPRLSSSEGIFKGFLKGVGGLVVTTGVDWSTKLWAPAYKDRPLMSFLSNSYDYMCDVQW
jgi:dynein intermediate chain